jgi:hypothetical protein
MILRRHAFTALLLGAASLGLVSCGEPTITSPSAASAGPNANVVAAQRIQGGALLGQHGQISCAPLPPAVDVEWIGPAGGTLHVGPHTFTVPAGALDHWVAITAYAPSGNSNRVRFFPEGLQFNTPASLTISYANCQIPPGQLRKLVAYVDANLNVLSYLNSTEDRSAQTVTGNVQHFSDYAIAY